MFETVEEFAAASQLNELEISSLKEILTEKNLAADARILAEQYFSSGKQKGSVSFEEEGAYFSRMRFGAAFFAAPKIPEYYNRLGFPESVMLESMTDLKVWLRNELRNQQVCGLSFRAWEWQMLLYRGIITRHGRLECRSECQYQHDPLYAEDGSLLLLPGDQVIDIHIPEDGPMDIDECIKSLRRMADFFAKYRKHINWKGFLCESWLLDSQFKKMLPETSNIIRFQNLGVHYPLEETKDTIFRIFGKVDADPEAVQNPTTLQKKTAAFIKEGGKFFEEGMFISKEIIK